QHVSPIVLMSKTPQRRPKDIILAAGRIGQKSSPLQSAGQPEHAAAVDFHELGQFAQRNRIAGFGDRLQYGQSSVKTLNRWRLLLWRTAVRFAVHVQLFKSRVPIGIMTLAVLLTTNRERSSSEQP